MPEMNTRQGMREIVLDTETTGGSYKGGDRVIDLGMVELIDGMPTGRLYQSYFEPRHPINPFAQKIHGLSLEMLQGQPLFMEKIDEIHDFIDGASILAHNSAFDQRFMRMEFERLGRAAPGRWQDTMKLAPAGKGGKGRSLTDLVDRLGIQGPGREVHGALIDAAYLAAVVVKIRTGAEIDVNKLLEGRDLSLPKPGGVGAPRAEPVDKRPAAFDRIHQVVVKAYEEADNFRDFLRRIEGAGIRVSPRAARNISSVGFRFRSDAAWSLGAAHGLKSHLFQSGILKVTPADLPLIDEMRERYHAEFGPVAEERLPQAERPYNSNVAHPTLQPRLSIDNPFEPIRSHEVSNDPALQDAILEVNKMTPGDRDAVKPVLALRSSRDSWSRFPPGRLELTAREIHVDQQRQIDMAINLPTKIGATCLRWMCRGLDPDHALIKTITEVERASKFVSGRPLIIEGEAVDHILELRRLAKQEPSVDV